MFFCFFLSKSLIKCLTQAEKEKSCNCFWLWKNVYSLQHICLIHSSITRRTHPHYSHCLRIFFSALGYQRGNQFQKAQVSMSVCLSIWPPTESSGAWGERLQLCPASFILTYRWQNTSPVKVSVHPIALGHITSIFSNWTLPHTRTLQVSLSHCLR